MEVHFVCEESELLTLWCLCDAPASRQCCLNNNSELTQKDGREKKMGNLLWQAWKQKTENIN